MKKLDLFRYEFNIGAFIGFIIGIFATVAFLMIIGAIK
jgi:hypothetical protein